MRVIFDYKERKQYPDFPEEFPDSWFNEEWAQKIHSQSLSHLNSRGGLSAQEMVMNIERLTIRQFEQITLDMAVRYLLLKASK
jgi:hypothetical protein